MCGNLFWTKKVEPWERLIVRVWIWFRGVNLGWYTHMQSLEEVREEALRYMNVIARPMVLQGDQHPIVWSHAYADFQVYISHLHSLVGRVQNQCDSHSRFPFHSYLNFCAFNESSQWMCTLILIRSHFNHQNLNQNKNYSISLCVDFSLSDSHLTV